MTIGIDGNEANVANRVGVSVYTYEMLGYFHSQASKQRRFVIFTRNAPLSDLPPQNEYFKYVQVPGTFMWRDLFMPLYLFTHQSICDVFFSPAHYTPRYCPVPCVVTIHDVAYHYFPDEFLKKDLYKLNNWTRHALTQAAEVIAVSEATKKDIMRIYKTPESKITLIHNGFKTSLKKPTSKDQAILSDLNISKDHYLLYVGTLQPRKDIPTLIKAFAQIHTTQQNLKLVIAGRKGWMYEEIFSLVKELDIDNAVIFTGYVSDAKLAVLYSNAAMFILPALYEGFGMPVLEAMYYGCPVITTTTPSLSEVGGDACIYFQPHDTMDLQKHIELILNDAKLRKGLMAKGKNHVKKFSWTRAAQDTLDLITQAANHANSTEK